MKLFKKTALLVKLNCAKHALIVVHYMIIPNFFCQHKTHLLWIQTCHVLHKCYTRERCMLATVADPNCRVQTTLHAVTAGYI